MKNVSERRQNVASATLLLGDARPSLFLHPLSVFSLVWIGVVFLYSLHLSKLLLYSTEEALHLVLIIWLSFAGMVALCTLLRKLFSYISSVKIKRKNSWLDLDLLDRNLSLAFKIWLAISAMEIVVSGGIPIVWLLQGSPKTYQDFGITSLHGLVNSLILSIALCRFGLFIITGARRHLRVPIFILFWSLIVVTRNMLLVALLEYLVLAFRLKSVSPKTVTKVIAGTIIFILIFGALGDFRSGSSDLIRFWAQPTDNYPEWLPSGILWAYIYASTPINNLIYTADISQPVNKLTFPNTVVTLFPTIIRKTLYGDDLSDAESGQLVTSTFNVSTAYIGPFQDYGLIGVSLFSIVIALACYAYWIQKDLRGALVYAVLLQCLILTLFFDHFFYLPIITQIPWIYFFLAKSKRDNHDLASANT